MSPMMQGIITVIVGVGGCVGYFFLSNLILDKVIFPPKPGDKGRNINRAEMVRPWLFLFPALFALTLYLVYPVIGSFWRSLYNRSGDEFIGFGNYQSMFTDTAFQTAFFNNFLWVLVVPAMFVFVERYISKRKATEPATVSAD